MPDDAPTPLSMLGAQEGGRLLPPLVTANTQISIHSDRPGFRFERMASGAIVIRVGPGASIILHDDVADETGRRQADRALDAIAQSIREFRVSEAPAEVIPLRPITMQVRGLSSPEFLGVE